MFTGVTATICGTAYWYVTGQYAAAVGAAPPEVLFIPAAANEMFSSTAENASNAARRASGTTVTTPTESIPGCKHEAQTIHTRAAVVRGTKCNGSV